MRRTILSSLGKMPTTSARRFTSLFNLSRGLVECNFDPVLAWEGHVGEHVLLGLVHQRAELGPAPAQLVGDVAPGFAGALAVRLDESLADGCGDHGVLAARHMGERCGRNARDSAARWRR